MNRIVCAAAAFALVLGLFATGCGKSSDSSGSSGVVTLKVWESLNGPDEFIKQAGEAYTKTRPNVRIEFVNVELDYTSDRIAEEGPLGTGPDIFCAPHDRLGELVGGGHVCPTVNPEQVRFEVLGSCSQAVTYEGTMYGYPVSAETYALFYNRALISDAEVPSTWEGMIDWAKKFNAANPGKRAFVMAVGNAYYTITFTTQNGNRLFGKSGTDVSSSYLNTEDSVRGMRLFQKLRSVLDVPSSELSTANCNAAFLEGKVALHITGLWNVKPFEEAGLDFGVAPLPALPGDSTPSASFSGTRCMFVSSYSKNQEVAADFAHFLLSPEMQKLRFVITGAMPSISTDVNSKYAPGFLKQLDCAFPMPSVPQMAGLWDAMGSACKKIWDGADVKSELDAADAALIGQ